MTRQFITFQIGEQSLGVDIMAIREIRAWTPTTILPHVPDHVRGVVNLRGTVLPVIDLGARLGWGLTDPTARHVIIVVRNRDQLQGLIVDAVSDIVTVEEAEMRPSPALTDHEAAECLDGIISINGGMVMLLALERLLVESFSPAAAEAA